MRLSDYLIVVDLPRNMGGDDQLLVHGYTGAFDIVSAPVARVLQSFSGVESAIEALTEALGEHQVALLKRRGYLTEWSHPEEQSFFKHYVERFFEYTKRNAAHYMIVPSYECNLRCPYCFQESPKARNDQADAGFKQADDEAISSVLAGIQTLDKKFGKDLPRRRRVVTFYGGEPLLAKNRSMVERCISSLRVEGETEFRAISNGTEIQAYEGLLGPKGIQEIQVTLDGPPQHHDARRMTATGGGTFHQIAENISFAIRHGTRINLRVNVDRSNIDTLPGLAREVLREKWDNSPMFWAYLAPVHKNKSANNGGRILDAEAFHKQIEVLGKTYPEMRVFQPPGATLKNQLLKLLQNGSDPILSIFKPTSCGAHTVMFIIDFAGGIYACVERTNNVGARVGQVLPGGDVRIYQSMMDEWRSRSIANTDRCVRCPYALFCGGGCAINSDGGDGDCNDFSRQFHRAAALAWLEFKGGGKATRWEGNPC